MNEENILKELAQQARGMHYPANDLPIGGESFQRFQPPSDVGSIRKGISRIESGGAFSHKELPVAGQVFSAFQEAKQEIEREVQSKVAPLRERMIREQSKAIRREEIESGSELSEERRNEISGQISGRYQGFIGQTKGKYQTQIERQEMLMQRANPIGMRIDPESLERIKNSTTGAAGIAGAASDITVETLRDDLTRTKTEMSKKGIATGDVSISRGRLSPMMQQILKKVERESDSTLESDRANVQEKLLSKTYKFIEANKDSANQIEKFTKEFGVMDDVIKGGSTSQDNFIKTMRGVQNAFVSVSRISTGLVSSIGAMSRGDLSGMFSGATTFMLGMGRLAKTMKKGGSTIGGAFGAGRMGGIIGGAMGVAGGIIGGGAGALLGLGALGIGAHQRQFKDAAQYEQAAYRMNLMQGNNEIPQVGSVLSMAKKASGGGLTVPQYQQVGIQAMGSALFSPQQAKRMTESTTERGITPLSEVARFAQAYDRPILELGTQIGKIARATGGGFQNIMESMSRMGEISGMGGSLFTGEMQKAFSQISQTLMQSLGGVRGGLRQGATEQLLSPMLSAGIGPSQAAGVAGSLQNFATGSIFDPQKRLLLESLGVSRSSIERGKGPGGITAAEDIIKSLGLSGEDLQNTAESGIAPSKFGAVKRLTGQNDTERAFTVLTRYIMGFSAGLSNSIIEMAVNTESVASLRKEINSLEKGSKIYNEKMKELGNATGKVKDGQDKYNETLKDQAALMSFKDKMISVSGSIASMFQGFLEKGETSEIMGRIKKAFEPILAIAGDTIIPSLELVESVITGLGATAEDMRKAIKGIDAENVTEQLNSGEFFKNIGGSISEGISSVLADAGEETMRLVTNKFVAEHPGYARAFGLEANFTEEELEQQKKNKKVKERFDQKLDEIRNPKSDQKTTKKNTGILDYDAYETFFNKTRNENLDRFKQEFGIGKDISTSKDVKSLLNGTPIESKDDLTIFQSINELSNSWKQNNTGKKGSPTGESIDVINKKGPINVTIHTNVGGTLVGTQNLVANDGSSFSSNVDSGSVLFIKK